MNSTLPLSVRAIFNNLDAINAVQERIRQLWTAVDCHSELTLSQAIHWYAVALEYRPDVIVELGRHYGNSTVAFTEAANRLGTTVVKSFCLSEGWSRRGVVASIVGDEAWFHPLQIHTADITRTDFASHIKDAKRVLILWDAHGFEVADAVLSRIMPLVALKDHIVICHDISDNRVVAAEHSYGSRPFWRGHADFGSAASRQPRARANFFWVNTIVDQALPIMDFCWRNGIELHSADFEFHQTTNSWAEAVQRIRGRLGLEIFSDQNHWVYFTLNEAGGSHHFPASAMVNERDHANGSSCLEGRILELESEIAALRSSTSWRITAPLRAIRRLLQ